MNQEQLWIALSSLKNIERIASSNSFTLINKMNASSIMPLCFESFSGVDWVGKSPHPIFHQDENYL